MNKIHSQSQILLNSIPQPLSIEEEIQFIKQIEKSGEATIHLAKWRGQTIAVKNPWKLTVFP